MLHFLPGLSIHKYNNNLLRSEQKILYYLGGSTRSLKNCCYAFSSLIVLLAAAYDVRHVIILSNYFHQSFKSKLKVQKLHDSHNFAR